MEVLTKPLVKVMSKLITINSLATEGVTKEALTAAIVTSVQESNIVLNYLNQPLGCTQVFEAMSRRNISRTNDILTKALNSIPFTITETKFYNETLVFLADDQAHRYLMAITQALDKSNLH